MFVSGAFDPRWNNDILNPAFRSLSASDFEVIELGWRGGAGSCAPSGTPAPFSVSQSARYVVLGWAGVADAGDYLVEVGSQPGASDLLIAPVGNVTSVGTLAPPGRYYVRVRARNGCGLSAPSNELLVVVA
jgi:hypothetical protein